MRFQDREDAGKELAELLTPYRESHPMVFGLPRGGVVVAYQVAHKLRAPLDVVVARKLGAPFNPEFAIGAVAPGGVVVLNEEAIRLAQVSDSYMREVIDNESAEVQRRLRLYRGDIPPLPDLRGRTAILVDDGLATGVTARAALRYLHQQNPVSVVFAAPVCAYETAQSLQPEVNAMVCIEMPRSLLVVGYWYRYFNQVPDETVTQLLERNWREVLVFGRRES